LITRYDPARFRRLEADFTAIVVWPTMSSAGSLNSVTRICLINRTVVEKDRGGIATATVLVHEAMHARLLRLGFRTDSATLSRVERTCKRAELHFLQTLPPFTGRDAAIAAVEAAVTQARRENAGNRGR
jgi:hypothetical protein